MHATSHDPTMPLLPLTANKPNHFHNTEQSAKATSVDPWSASATARV